jgi:hypothetical protein
MTVTGTSEFAGIASGASRDGGDQEGSPVSESGWRADRRIPVRDLPAATGRGARWAVLTSDEARSCP